MNEIDTLAQAIVAAHADLALPASGTAAPEPPSSDPIARAATLAAHALGFIAADVRCIASAWQRQVQRIGAFDASHWPDDAVDFGLAPRPRADAFAPCPPALGLYAVLPDAAWVGRMARAGVPTVQLRFKSADAGAVRAEVDAAVAAVQGTRARLFVNDHWRDAIAAGAYGVHLGQEDLDAVDTDALDAVRSAGLRLGLSTHGYAEMLRADAASPSYIALGAVFPTTLKRMATAAQGTGRLQAYARLMRGMPRVAIGGIDESRLDAVCVPGVGSVAVVRALVGAADPEAAAVRLTARLAARLQPDSAAS